MPSSPASDTGRDLRQLTERYDLALEAALRTDLERCSSLIEQAGVLISSLPPAANDTDDERGLRAAARSSYERVGAALQSALAATNADLDKVRQGRKVLRGYSIPTQDVGDRVESRG